MEESNQYFELMELSPEASLDQIRRRYRYLKALYAGDSIEISALHDDFSQEMLADYLQRLDRAFEKLNALHEKNKAATATVVSKKPDPELQGWLAQIDRFDGAALKAVRERLGVDLQAIFTVTRIQPRFLEDIEAQAFGSFPAEVYLRSYLIEYSRFLGLESQRVLADYLPRYREWAAGHKGSGGGCIEEMAWIR